MPYQRIIPAAIVAIAIGALGLTLSAQLLFDKEPCVLCLYQRIPFIVTGLLALTALRLEGGSVAIAPILVACGLIYLGGGGVAIYHIGVEQHWWISGCSGVVSESVTLDQLRASLMQRPDKACDEIDWTLFGISMATYNAVFSNVVGLAVIAGGIQLSKTRRHELEND